MSHGSVRGGVVCSFTPHRNFISFVRCNCGGGGGGGGTIGTRVRCEAYNPTYVRALAF